MKNESGKKDKKKSALEERIIAAIRAAVEEIIREEMGKLPKSFLETIKTK